MTESPLNQNRPNGQQPSSGSAFGSQGAPSPSQPAAEEPKPDPVEEVEEEVIEEEAEFEDIDTDRPTAGEFSWRDVSLVSSFVQQYSASSPERKGFFQDFVSVWGDPIDLAQGLYPPDGVVHKTDFISNLADSTQGSASPSEAMRRGIELASTIGNMEVEEIRSITKMVNTLFEQEGFAKDPEEVVNIRYRRNMETTEVLDLVMSSMENLSEKGVEGLKWARQLLSVWPESA